MMTRGRSGLILGILRLEPDSSLVAAAAAVGVEEVTCFCGTVDVEERINRYRSGERVEILLDANLVPRATILFKTSSTRVRLERKDIQVPEGPVPMRAGGRYPRL